MGWKSTDNGETIGTRGSENGVIDRDEEYDNGARITLERGCDHAPVAITCGIYGWMVHTRFLSTEHEGTIEYEQMKESLAAILEQIPLVDEPGKDQKMRQVSLEIQAFVEAFPT
jgi:hypothetical protein